MEINKPLRTTQDRLYIVEQMTLQDCKDIHDAIKLHPFRLNCDKNLADDYANKCFLLLEGCYKLSKDNDHKAIYGMYHDFSAGLSGLRYGKKLSGDFGIHHECCLQTLHKFCDGIPITEFWTHYTGCNILKGWPRLTRKYWKNNLWNTDLTLEQAKEAYADFKEKTKNGYSMMWDENYEKWLLAKIKELDKC